ncbi:MAG: hypothetical protein GY778_30115 [bacterium]|nr:hypothetical protein [bacterium]
MPHHLIRCVALATLVPLVQPVRGETPTAPDLPRVPPPARTHVPFQSRDLIQPINGGTDRPMELLEATDLNVTFVERTPRYDFDAAKNNPDPGDSVTFRGHIKNWGTSSVPSVVYRWQLDDVTVHSDTLVNVGPGEERVVTWSWTWADGNHWIKLTADPDDLVAESSEANNELEDRTNAIIAGFWVEQSVYDYFHQYQQDLGVGSNSWEDWIQRHMAKQNDLYEQAIWPISPQGALDRVRIDKLVVVPDGALPLNGGLPSNHPDTSDKTVDLMWGFPATLLDGTFYADHTSTSENNPFYLEKSLLHELGHARYLIDCYGFDVHNTASYHSVQIWEGSTYVAGSAYMPFIAWGEVLYYNQSGGVMSGPYGFQWSPYETAALNLIAGQRALCGNYNAPCNIGVYLQDLPANNHVRFADGFDRPRANASVRIYRAGTGPGWYGKTFDNTPDAEYTTDAQGYIDLPRNPFNPGGSIAHTYGHANGVMILRIQHVEQIWYRFMEASDFNMAYWAGDTQHAYYTVVLDGPNDDTDADSLPDDWEIQHFGDLSHNANVDEEPDGLTNLEEFNHGTDPLDPDSDGDGLSDGDEVHIHGTDPAAADTDQDGLDDAAELAGGTDPNDADTDDDLMTDGWEVANGLDPLVNDSALDPDNDGFANVDEFNANTDPMAPWSIPVPPQPGQALDFDGVDDFVELGDVAVSGSQLAVEAWVYPQAAGAARVLEKLEDYGVQLTAGNTVRFVTKHGFTWDNLDGQVPCNPDEWAHIACVLDGNNKSIYINGQLDTQTSYGFDVKVTTNSLIMGADSPGAGQGYFDAVIDDVRVWSVGRSEADIQATMNIGLSGSEAGLVGYWNLDEGSGQIANDLAGAHDGRLGTSSGPDNADPVWVVSNVVPDPSAGAGPAISSVVHPDAVAVDVPAVVTATISDAAGGDEGVAAAILYYAYGWPFNDFSVAGAGPGGSGDGTWSFTIPAQGPTHQGQSLLFFLRADDGAGNPSFATNNEQLYAFAIGTPGDWDGDGDVDLADHAGFMGCLSGPGGGPLDPGCAAVDFDGDDDADLQDFAALQALFGGS